MEIKITDKLSQQVLSIDGKTSLASTEVIIGEEQPDEGKLWIDTGEISNLGTEVVDNINGTQTNKAPSVRAVVQDLVSILYPVGSIYMSTNSTNPKDLFGIGEWEQIKDTFLMSAGNTYGAGTIGGTASHTHSFAHTHGVPGVSHTHLLSDNGYAKISMHGTGKICYHELKVPSFSANFYVQGSSGGSESETDNRGPGLGGRTEEITPSATTTNSQSTSTSGSGGSTTLDITPACEAAYCWKRTA